MSEVRLGYDIDGVLGEFANHFLSYFRIEDKSEPLFWSDPRFKENFYLTYDNKDFWMTMPILVDPKRLPYKPHCYITARPIPNEWTIEWLWKNGFPFAPVYTVGEKGKKAEIFRQSGANYFIDDALHNFDELTKEGIPCFLKTRSQNLGRETNMRVDFLADLPKAIKDYQNRTPNLPIF